MKTKGQRWLIVLFCLLMARSALAGILTVSNANESGPYSLRQRIVSDSRDGDTINFDSSVTGTITLASPLSIGKDLTIIGPGAKNLSISSSNNCRVFIISNAIVSLSGLTISGGLAQGAGGTFGNPNGADGQGGGIFNSGALTLLNCTITGNQASGGNAYIGEFGFAGNGGSGLGGGIYSSGTLVVKNCTVSFNSASGTGGNENGMGGGGGIYLVAGLLVNCTIASNSATIRSYNGPAAGGGIYVAGSGITLISCTVSGNNSTGGVGDVDVPGGSASGGGIYTGGTPTLENTIVSGNSVLAGLGDTNGMATGPDVWGSVISMGFNLIGQSDGSSGWIDDLTGATNSPLDAKLGPLGDNGGSTPTMELLPSSPAIDQGSSFGLTTDQRGEPRPFDFPNIPNSSAGITNGDPGDESDIGAFEVTPGPPLLELSVHAPFGSTIGSNAGTAALNLNLSWTNTSPGTGAQRNMPIHVVQTLSSLDSDSGVTNGWMTVPMPTKLFNNKFVTRDQQVGSNAFYRLIGPAHNASFIPPPATLSASNVTAQGAVLNGTVFPGGNQTLYWIEYGTETNYDQTTPTNSLDTDTNQIGVNLGLGGLVPLTRYHYQLVVMDDWPAPYNIQYGGDQQFITGSAASAAPAVVTTPSPQVFSNCPTCFSALLQGTVNPEGGPTVAWFYYYSDSLTGDTTPRSAGSGNSTTGFQQSVPNLEPNTTYYFKIVASNSVGVSYGDYQAFSTVPPEPPAVVTMDATYLGGFNDFAPIPVLNGTVNGNAASFTGYFQFGLDTNNYSFDTSQYPFSGNNNSPQSFSFAVTNVVLNSSSTYYFRIVAFNGGSEGIGGDKTFTTP